ncbi:glycosyltransferase family 4 protein [Patescibacteria group bacterium]|nr:glycosyltransferase family 4 protein [Patescibacteria group bacterium]
MHIAIETSPMTGAHRLRGTGVYTKMLIGALEKYERSNSYTLFTRGEKLPGNADIAHYPYFDTFFHTLPLLKRTPTVVTVHDLIPIAFPDHFPKGKRGSLMWKIQQLSLVFARRVVTDSLASKKDIVRFTGISPGRVDVVPLAPGPDMKPVANERTVKRIRTSYSLPRQYLLYVGDVNWNKNLPGLIDIFSILHAKIPELRLVLAGKAVTDENLPETRAVLSKAETLRLAPFIVRTGFIPDTDLPAVYSMAACYMQPSFAEGFGLPVLEAMACGCPAVVSGRSSLAEIAGPSLTADPADPEEFAGAVLRTLRTDRKEWQKKASAWLAGYSLKRMARETSESYRKALEDTRT